MDVQKLSDSSIVFVDPPSNEIEIAMDASSATDSIAAGYNIPRRESSSTSLPDLPPHVSFLNALPDELLLSISHDLDEQELWALAKASLRLFNLYQPLF